MSFGVNYPDLYRRVAVYVDRIFKGTKPCRCNSRPRWNWSSTIKLAKALGIDLSPKLLALADEVIE